MLVLVDDAAAAAGLAAAWLVVVLQKLAGDDFLSTNPFSE